MLQSELRQLVTRWREVAPPNKAVVCTERTAYAICCQGRELECRSVYEVAGGLKRAAMRAALAMRTDIRIDRLEYRLALTFC